MLVTIHYGNHWCTYCLDAVTTLVSTIVATNSQCLQMNFISQPAMSHIRCIVTDQGSVSNQVNTGCDVAKL